MERPDRQQSIATLARIATPPGVAIRPWMETDFPAIQALSDAEGWPTPRTRPDEAREAWRQSWPALVATKRGDVIAFVRALTDGQVTLFITELLVAPAWQGKGIGRCMLDACHALYPHARIELFATESSASFYTASGFRPFHGYRKSYMTADVVIIGGGVSGAAIARELARRGVGVALVERGEIGSGTTGLGGGGIILQTKRPGPHLTLGLRSARLLRAMAPELGAIGYAMRGALVLLPNAEATRTLEPFLATQRAAGLPVVVLNRAEVLELEPNLTGAYAGATYLPPMADGITDAHVDPASLAQAYARAATEAGATIHTGTTVTAIRTTAGRVTSVVTDRGEITCGIVVNAAGVWAPDIAAMIGVAVPITPRRGQWLRTAPGDAPTIHRPILEAAYLLATFDPAYGTESPDPFLRMGGALTLMPRLDGSTFVGNSREFAGYDATPNSAMTGAILAHATAFMPSLASAPIATRGAGLRPATPDGLPILGPVEGVEGFFMAAGHEGDGVALSAITGQLIADAITTGAQTDLAPFLLSRFAISV
jgi:glycine/D-amino acid oxidase-like deaminating enzyme/GNAT superfamily N-acetyltransferase